MRVRRYTFSFDLILELFREGNVFPELLNGEYWQTCVIDGIPKGAKVIKSTIWHLKSSSDDFVLYLEHESFDDIEIEELNYNELQKVPTQKIRLSQKKIKKN